ncbi:MAG: SDR family oxidoreductase [Armatimonadetes bacterium]|nr:SDR family oxidoreductase [Armatimonadota bacterium]
MGMLEGKTAIITGSGRGIGKAAALLMAREGAAVVVSDLDEGPARETVEEITAAGGKAAVCAGDVTNPDFPEKLIKTALDIFGGLHIIVNNAGYTWDGMLHKMSDEQWQAMFDVHVNAPFRIIRAAAPYIRESAKKEIAEGKRVMRKIVNVMSVAGTRGNTGQINYSSAKAALRGLTKTVAQEWGPLNVNCNAVAFGFVATRLTEEKEKGIKIMDDKIAVGIPKNLRDLMVAMIPLQRPATPEEAAGGILFLVSPLSDYVTGHILHVDGGIDM